MPREVAVLVARVNPYTGARSGLRVNVKRPRRFWRTSPSRRRASEDDGHRDLIAPPICGRCLAVSAKTGRRCKRSTCLDYRHCPQHLALLQHLAIAPSRRLRDLGVPNKALGLYAVDPATKLAKDREGFPTFSAAAAAATAPVVYRRGEVVAEYGGEHLTQADFDERYGDAHNRDTAAYAEGFDPDGSGVIDGLAAASAATYSNEALDVAALYRRARTYAAFIRLYNNAARTAANRALVNVDSEQRGGGAAAMARTMLLIATRQIRHGEEIVWNYGHGYWGTESMKRYVTGRGW